jgi:hypothetical protein
VQKLARGDKYALWKRDPHHPSLHFEERRNGICVVRIGAHYRALGLREGDIIAWFWIGNVSVSLIQSAQPRRGGFCSQPRTQKAFASK